MNREEIFKLIEDNGLTLHGDIEHFAALVASAERETCAKVCDDLWEDDYTAFACAEAIRARGQP